MNAVQRTVLLLVLLVVAAAPYKKLAPNHNQKNTKNTNQ